MKFIFIIRNHAAAISEKCLALSERAVRSSDETQSIVMKKAPWKLALFLAIIAFPVSFLIFNVAYIYWAVKAYPHNNSMAGMAVFFYGFPVALACSLVTFVIVFAVSRSKRARRLAD